MLIIPDVHGRDFWKEPVKNYLSRIEKEEIAKDSKIIFLGDYLDPYSLEGISMQMAYERFKEIIELKRTYPDNVVLLLGNHDWAYINPIIFKCSRHDIFFEEDVKELFLENEDIFQMVYIEMICGKNMVFSHAGILKSWAADILKADDCKSIAEIYNRPFTNIDKVALSALNCISKVRGGRSLCGSMIWADVHEFPEEKFDNAYQVFGHTLQMESPIITDSYACLDYRCAFELDTKEGLKFEMLL